MKDSIININRLKRHIFQIAIFISLTFICNSVSKAQLSFIAGGNYSNVRSNISLENKGPIAGYNFGLSYQYYPFKGFRKISILNELVYNRKGYRQDFEKEYTSRFNYLSLPVLVNYSLSKDFAIQSGFEMSKLIATNIEQGLDTYNNFDVGLVFGISYLKSKRLSCYSRFTYGLLPMLDYYNIDELGNFKNEIHDVKNVCFSIGIKFILFE